MIYNLYAIRDVKTGYMTPTVDPGDAAATRNFGHAISHSDGIINSYSQDFSLYRLGTYDTDTGQIVPESVPVLVVDGASLKIKED